MNETGENGTVFSTHTFTIYIMIQIKNTLNYEHFNCFWYFAFTKSVRGAALQADSQLTTR